MYCEAYAGYIYLFTFLYGRYKGFKGVMDMYIVWDVYPCILYHPGYRICML